jgi:hypothetical protein
MLRDNNFTDALSGDNNFTDAPQRDNNFTDAGQLVRSHNNEVTLALSMQQCNVIFYGRLKKKILTLRKKA